MIPPCSALLWWAHSHKAPAHMFSHARSLPLPQVIPARLPEFSLDHLTDLVEDLNKLG